VGCRQVREFLAHAGSFWNGSSSDLSLLVWPHDLACSHLLADLLYPVESGNGGRRLGQKIWLFISKFFIFALSKPFNESVQLSVRFEVDLFVPVSKVLLNSLPDSVKCI
jgi:hypothetical protein